MPQIASTPRGRPTTRPITAEEVKPEAVVLMLTGLVDGVEVMVTTTCPDVETEIVGEEASLDVTVEIVDEDIIGGDVCEV